ncbi:MAG: MgtE intracellular region [Candidatus Gottesmanbacteria bacterium GW2011_GWA1_43_11]|uniref:MgtE intracellular region n=1 Tax=Candidatus Gottesmanbacteria bacterium GW2011_GWA1_43_11 TaxID=1618436 RepID=A0A0G1CF75_9BACT|nr:MAG: MgtE intracellular region [Candidatus Gottesmanbacteria bacterium GW2011_GWA1_43_11]
MEVYLSELLGRKIFNKSKENIGTLEDLVVRELDKRHPPISGLLIKRGRKKDLVYIPAHDVDEVSTKQMRLTTDIVDLTPFQRRENEIQLVNDMYDKQIVDIDDRRLTRVNDLLLEVEKPVIRLRGVDVSVLGLLHRLHIPSIFGILKHNIVDWEDAQFLGGQGQVKFNVQYKNLESLHAVDIARIIFEGPGYKQGSKVLAALKDPIAADIIEELSPKLQKNLIESMRLEDVADVIKHMPPDKAADLFISLGPAYAQKVFPLLNKEDGQKILALLSYPEHTTGAYMTTDYLAVSADLNFEEATKLIQDSEEVPDFAYYIYVLENKLSNKLVGVLAAHEFLLAQRRSRIESIMKKRPFVAYPQDHIKKTIRRMYRYNISALPVVSKSENKLLGIVTFRDAISVYLPRRLKARIRQVFTNGFSSEQNYG